MDQRSSKLPDTPQSAPWSLRREVSKSEFKWRSGNQTARRLKYPPVRQLLVEASHRPILYVVALSFFFLFCGLISRYLSRDTLSTLGAGWKSGDWVGYFQTLWQVQATVVGLVYPFVISFVTFLLQRRASGSIQLHVYLADSGALIAGMSSFLLALTMPVQFMLIVHFPRFGELRWAVVDTLWFLLNGLLTLWFLFRTVAFIRPDEQRRIVTRYAVNVALTTEVRHQLMADYFQSAQDLGWLPGMSYAKARAANQPVVMLGFGGYDRGTTQVIRTVSGRVRISEIRFVLLRIVIKRWLKRVARGSSKDSTRPARANGPLLSFPLYGNAEFDEDVVLCRVENGPALSNLERKLVRLSFQLDHVGPGYSSLATEEILKEVASDARVALQERDIAGFEAKYSELVKLHKTLLEATLAVVNDAPSTSYALLASRASPYLAMHVAWSHTYVELAKDAVELLPNEFLPIRRLCYVARHISGVSPLSRQPLVIRQRLIALSGDVVRIIGEWWKRKAGEQQLPVGGPAQKVLLPAPAGATYEAVATYIVGAWEAVREDLVPLKRLRDDATDESWDDAIELAFTHLERTNHLLLSAVVRGDQCLAEWFMDSLEKWWEQVTSLRNPSYHLLSKTDFLTIDDVPMAWENVATFFGIQENELEFYRQRKVDLLGEAYSLALSNVWRDTELLAILVLVTWSFALATAMDNSLALHIVSGWLSGRLWREGGSGITPIGQLDASGLLTAFIRQHTGGSYQTSYGSRLNGIVSTAASLRKAEMVPGRIYSGFGIDNIDELIDAQLALLIVRSDSDWQAGASLSQQLSAWTNSDFAKAEQMRGLLATMLERLSGREGSFHNALCEWLIHARGASHTVGEGVVRVTAALETLRGSADIQQVQAEAQAPITQERLLALAQVGTGNAFEKDAGPFPIFLFRQVSHTQTPHERFTLNIPKQRRGEFTDPPMAPVPVNQAEFFAEVVSNHVGLILLNDVLGKLPRRDIEVDGEAAYWKMLAFEAERLRRDSLSPILIVASVGYPTWLFDWLYNLQTAKYSRPADMEVRWPVKNELGSPLAYINEIAIYVASVSHEESWLVPAEAFESVEFTEFAPGIFVDVEFDPVPGAENLVDLKLSIERSVIAGNHEAVRFMHPASRSSQEANEQSH